MSDAPTGEYGAEGSLRRQGGWGGPGRQYGAVDSEGSLGRTGVCPGRKEGARVTVGAEGSLGRRGVWVGGGSGAEGGLGRKGAWGGT